MVVDVKKLIGKCCNRIVNIAFGVCIAIIVFLALQLFFVTSFKIPSDSMEPTLLGGDYILVEKCSKGARLFNFPYPARWDSIGLNLMTYYVKRCVALPGDTLEIRDAHYLVRNCTQPLGNVEGQDFLQSVFESGKVKEWRIAVRS